MDKKIKIGIIGMGNIGQSLAIELAKQNNTFDLHIVGRSTCKKHKPMRDKLGYVAWQDWVEDKINAGHDQVQCNVCKKWLFESEI